MSRRLRVEWAGAVAASTAVALLAPTIGLTLLLLLAITAVAGQVWP